MQTNHLGLFGAMAALAPFSSSETPALYRSCHDPERKKKKEKNRAKTKRAKASRKRNRK